MFSARAARRAGTEGEERDEAMSAALVWHVGSTRRFTKSHTMTTATSLSFALATSRPIPGARPEQEGLLLRVGGDVAVGPKEHVGALVVLGGDAQARGQVGALLVVGGDAQLEGSEVDDLTVVGGRARWREGGGAIALTARSAFRSRGRYGATRPRTEEPPTHGIIPQRPAHS